MSALENVALPLIYPVSDEMKVWNVWTKA
jgi:hypothetical protein